jgi:hypothetical protein
MDCDAMAPVGRFIVVPIDDPFLADGVVTTSGRFLQ